MNVFFFKIVSVLVSPILIDGVVHVYFVCLVPESNLLHYSIITLTP